MSTPSRGRCSSSVQGDYNPLQDALLAAGLVVVEAGAGKYAIKAGGVITDIATGARRGGSDGVDPSTNGGRVETDSGSGGSHGVRADGTEWTLSQIDDPIDLTNGRSGHILANHGPGSGKVGKTEFPENWDDDRIIHQVSDVATDPYLVRRVDDRGTPYVVGMRDGIEIRVNFFPDTHARAGQIATAYPTSLSAN